jgi:Transcriptional regulator/sugar kinase
MYYIGIDIGGTSIKGGVVDETGKIYAKSETDTLPERSYAEIFGDVWKLAKKVVADANLTLDEISGIGMGIPGTINSDEGIITYSNNIRFEKVPVAAEMAKYTKIPVKIGNDANCAALGEKAFGAAKEMKDIILITLGTGVGSGIILNGKLFQGKNGAGAECGHIALKVGGEPCTCGKNGCWEAYASASALINQTRKQIGLYPESRLAKIAEEEGRVSGRTAFKAAREGDEAGEEVVRRYIRYVAEGLVSLVNVLRPEAILIGGGISNEGDYLIDRLQKLVAKYSYGGRRNPYVKVIKAELMNDAGILGAAALCL